MKFLCHWAPRSRRNCFLLPTDSSPAATPAPKKFGCFRSGYRTPNTAKQSLQYLWLRCSDICGLDVPFRFDTESFGMLPRLIGLPEHPLFTTRWRVLQVQGCRRWSTTAAAIRTVTLASRTMDHGTPLSRVCFHRTFPKAPDFKTFYSIRRRQRLLLCQKGLGV